MHKLTFADIAKFHTFYTPVTECGCWLWEKSVDQNGYGYFAIARKTFRSHRVSYFIENGQIPNGLSVLHKCDNPFCVNPSHLFLGTNQDNVTDKISKDRHIHGTRHYAAKLTEQQVKDMRAVYPVKGYRSLAKEYGVSREVVRDIVKGKSWRFVK